jgi:hypothetical protein
MEEFRQNSITRLPALPSFTSGQEGTYSLFTCHRMPHILSTRWRDIQNVWTSYCLQTSLESAGGRLAERLKKKKKKKRKKILNTADIGARLGVT